MKIRITGLRPAQQAAAYEQAEQQQASRRVLRLRQPTVSKPSEELLHIPVVDGIARVQTGPDGQKQFLGWQKPPKPLGGPGNIAPEAVSRQQRDAISNTLRSFGGQDFHERVLPQVYRDAGLGDYIGTSADPYLLAGRTVEFPPWFGPGGRHGGTGQLPASGKVRLVDNTLDPEAQALVKGTPGRAESVSRYVRGVLPAQKRDLSTAALEEKARNAAMFEATRSQRADKNGNVDPSANQYRDALQSDIRFIETKYGKEAAMRAVQRLGEAGYSDMLRTPKAIDNKGQPVKDKDGRVEYASNIVDQYVREQNANRAIAPLSNQLKQRILEKANQGTLAKIFEWIGQGAAAVSDRPTGMDSATLDNQAAAFIANNPDAVEMLKQRAADIQAKRDKVLASGTRVYEGPSPTLEELRRQYETEQNGQPQKVRIVGQPTQAKTDAEAPHEAFNPKTGRYEIKGRWDGVERFTDEAGQVHRKGDTSDPYVQARAVEDELNTYASDPSILDPAIRSSVARNIGYVQQAMRSGDNAGAQRYLQAIRDMVHSTTSPEDQRTGRVFDTTNADIAKVNRGEMSPNDPRLKDDLAQEKSVFDTRGADAMRGLIQPQHRSIPIPPSMKVVIRTQPKRDVVEGNISAPIVKLLNAGKDIIPTMSQNIGTAANAAMGAVSDQVHQVGTALNALLFGNSQPTPAQTAENPEAVPDNIKTFRNWWRRDPWYNSRRQEWQSAAVGY